jgi:hypothetical protein
MMMAAAAYRQARARMPGTDGDSEIMMTDHGPTAHDHAQSQHGDTLRVSQYHVHGRVGSAVEKSHIFPSWSQSDDCDMQKKSLDPGWVKVRKALEAALYVLQSVSLPQMR